MRARVRVCARAHAHEHVCGRTKQADTSSARFRNGLGRSYYLRRDYPAAAAEFARAVELDSLFARAHFNLGNALLRLGNKEDGRRELAIYKDLDEQENRIESMKNTLLVHPDRFKIYHDIAVIHGQRGEYELAKNRYLQAIERAPSFAPSHHNLGNIYLRQKNMAAAVREFQQALVADSTYALSHLALGNAHMMRREIDLAIGRFELALRYDPDSAVIRRNLVLAKKIRAESRPER